MKTEPLPPLPLTLCEAVPFRVTQTSLINQRTTSVIY
jgi:hypothetical protein